MDAHAFLRRLRSEGFDLRLEGETLKVAPADRLTDELRQHIRQTYDDLLALLRAESEGTVSARPRDGWLVTQGRDVAHWFRHGDAPLSDGRGWPIYPLCGNTGNASRWTAAPPDELGLTWRMCRTCHRRRPKHQEATRRSEAADELIRSTGCLPPVEVSP